MAKVGKPIVSDEERERKLKGVVETFRNKHGVTIVGAEKRKRHQK